MLWDELTQVDLYFLHSLSRTIKYVSFRLVNKLVRSSRDMSDKNRPIPHFNNEDEERSFWAIHDSTEFIDWNTAEKNPTFPQLKPSTRPVSIRLPESLIAELKMLANKMDVPYQSLMKTILAEKVREELAPYNHPGTE
jgi:predicted DNA binding CopG/RHH family protein